MVKKTKKTTATNTVRNIRRNSRRKYSGEEKIRIVLEGLRGEETVAGVFRGKKLVVGIGGCGGRLRFSVYS